MQQMINSLAITPTPPSVAPPLQQETSDRSSFSSGSVPKPAPAADAASSKPQPHSDVRLMVEERKHAPGFVYKLVDALTGATLAEIPREADTGAPPQGYAAGHMLRTTA